MCINFLRALVVICTVSLFQISSAYAVSGCCSQHGGVAGCNSSTGFLKCKDGTTSPTCKCDDSVAKPSKATKRVFPAAVVPAAVLSTTGSDKSTAGCCSGHGGVKSCDKKSGFYKCKDGSLSSSCKCGKTKATKEKAVKDKTTKAKAKTTKEKATKAKSTTKTKATKAKSKTKTTKTTSKQS